MVASQYTPGSHPAQQPWLKLTEKNLHNITYGEKTLINVYYISQK